MAVRTYGPELGIDAVPRHPQMVQVKMQRKQHNEKPPSAQKLQRDIAGPAIAIAPNDELPGDIENHLKRIDDKFVHLNENLQKYQEILEPARHQLEDRNDGGLEGVGVNTLGLTGFNKVLSSSRQNPSVDNELMSHAMYTNTTHGRAFNLDDTIQDASQADGQDELARSMMDGRRNQANSQMSRNQKVFDPATLRRKTGLTTRAERMTGEHGAFPQ